MELSIDTSTRYASVGLSRDGEAIAELTWRSERNHSVELVPAIRALMERSGVDMGRIEAVFVARGPGAFSALRVGMSTAKALAMALDVALASVGTLDIEAQPYLGLGHRVKAIIGAGRDRFYVGSYGDPAGEASPSYEVMDFDTLVSGVEPGTLVCGEGVPGIADALRQRCRGALLADTPPPTRRAGTLAYLGHQRRQGGEADDPMSLQPVYLRSSQVRVAERTWLGT